jgi:hypothetical protein
MQVPAAAVDLFAMIGSAATHHAALFAPQAPLLLNSIISKFEQFVETPSDCSVSQNSLWAAGKLLVAFAHLRLPLVHEEAVWSFVLQRIFNVILRCWRHGLNQKGISLILVNAITALYRIAIIKADAVHALLTQSSECGLLLRILTNAPLNPKLFPQVQPAAAAAADDHDFFVCGRGCVVLFSKFAAGQAHMNSLQPVMFLFCV